MATMVFAPRLASEATILLLFDLFILSTFFVLVKSDGTVDLESYTAFQVQRTCAQSCLLGRQTDGHRGVILEIGCTSPFQKDCMCNTAQASSWSNGLSTCISDYCDNKPADLTAALSLYDHYCTGDLTFVTKAATVSLSDQTSFGNQISCVRNCLLSGFPSNIVRQLQCSKSPAYNDCYCRGDLKTDAEAFLTTCVNSLCDGDANQIGAAVLIYGDYCLSAAQAAVTGGGDQNGGGGSNTIPGSGPADGLPSETGSSDGAGSSDSGASSSLGTIIGSIVGGLFVVAFLGIIILLWRRRRSRPIPPSEPPVWGPPLYPTPPGPRSHYGTGGTTYSPDGSTQILMNPPMPSPRPPVGSISSRERTAGWVKNTDDATSQSSSRGGEHHPLDIFSVRSD